MEGGRLPKYPPSRWDVAQLAEQGIVNPTVTGSSPVIPAIGGKRSHDPRTNATECTSRPYGLLGLVRTYCGGRSRTALGTSLWC